MDKMSAYAEAMGDFNRATATVEQIGKEIGKANAAFLSGWQTTMVSGTEFGFPPEVTHNASRAGKTIDAETFPTAHDIAEALSAWHRSKHNLTNAWLAVPAREREALKPPPGVPAVHEPVAR